MDPTPPSTPTSCSFLFRIGHRVLWVILIGVVYVAFLAGLMLYGGAMLHHAYTPDLPWILQAGHTILETHRLPTHDLFSWTFPEKPWVLYQWLFELITAFLHQQLGEQGLLRLFIIFVPLVYVFVPMLDGASKRIPVVFTILVSLLALDTVVINMSLRPMMVTSVFLAMQYWAISRYRRGQLPLKILLPLLVGIYVLWGNLHTGVFLGFVSLGLMAFGDWLERRQIYRFDPPTSPPERFQTLGLNAYGLMAAFGFLASLINPYGPEIYRYLVNLSGQSYLNDVIVELQSPNFHFHAYQFFTVLLLIFILLMPRAHRVYPAHALLHLVVFTLAMLCVQRFVVWTCLFYVLMLPQALAYYWQDVSGQHPPIRAILTRAEMLKIPLMATLLLLSGVFLAMPQFFPPVSHGKCESLLKGVAAYQALKQPTDVLFNDAETGSCTLIQYPDQKVMIDTRFDFYGQDFMRAYKQTSYLLGDWEGFLSKWRINTLMMLTNKPLVQLLKSHPDYETLYRDRNVTLLRKRHPPESGM